MKGFLKIIVILLINEVNCKRRHITEDKPTRIKEARIYNQQNICKRPIAGILILYLIFYFQIISKILI